MNNLFLGVAFVFTIVAVAAIWHMDINHNLDRLGEKKTRGVLSLTPEKGYRFSQYILLIVVLLYDLLILYFWLSQKPLP